MTTNSPNPVDGDVKELISEAEAIIELFESAGCLKQVAYRLAKVALASLKAINNPVGWTDAQELRDVEKDGCGYLFTANPITPNADERRVIMLYTTPPAQLLRLPVKADRNHPNFYGTSDDFCAGWNHHDAEVQRLNATAQPISDGLYRIANHIAGAKNALPQEWQDWAEEIESDLRTLAAAPGGK